MREIINKSESTFVDYTCFPGEKKESKWEFFSRQSKKIRITFLRDKQDKNENAWSYWCETNFSHCLFSLKDEDENCHCNFWSWKMCLEIFENWFNYRQNDTFRLFLLCADCTRIHWCTIVIVAARKLAPKWLSREFLRQTIICSLHLCHIFTLTMVNAFTLSKAHILTCLLICKNMSETT